MRLLLVGSLVEVLLVVVTVDDAEAGGVGTAVEIGVGDDADSLQFLEEGAGTRGRAVHGSRQSPMWLPPPGTGTQR